MAALETAITLDPQNPELVGVLVETYRWLRRYQDAERIEDRLFAIEPDKPEHRTSKAWWTFVETADVNTARTAYDMLPSSVKDDPGVASDRAYLALCARDFDAAEQVLRESSGQEIGFVGSALAPRQIFALWIEFLRGNHPTTNQFGAAREQLSRKIEADPTNPYLMTALAYADMALGRKAESIQEGQRAMEMRPISEDALSGPDVAAYVSMLYALANQLDSAFDQLNILVKIPSGLPNYGDLKTNPGWDPLRKDPRFGKLLAELAPRD